MSALDGLPMAGSSGVGNMFTPSPVSSPNFLGLSSGALTNLLPVLGGVAGAFPTPQSSSGNTTGSSSGNSTTSGFANSTTGQTGTATTTPNLTPQLQSLLNSLTSSYSSLANPSLSGYQASADESINKNTQAQLDATNSEMAARGLASSPVAATTESNVRNQGAGQQVQVANSIPLLQNQYQLQNLGAVMSFLNSTPGLVGSTQGTTQTGTTAQNNTGTTGQSQNSQQQTQQQQQSGGGIGGAIGGIASMLAGLFL